LRDARIAVFSRFITDIPKHSAEHCDRPGLPKTMGALLACAIGCPLPVRSVPFGTGGILFFASADCSRRFVSHRIARGDRCCPSRWPHCFGLPRASISELSAIGRDGIQSLGGGNGDRSLVEGGACRRSASIRRVVDRSSCRGARDRHEQSTLFRSALRYGCSMPFKRNQPKV
jgi:hypothetical protein